MNKSPLTAFLLSFIPGAGHAYLGRPIRTVLYGGAFFGPLVLLLLLSFANNGGDEVLVLLFISVMSWGINMMDMIITLVSGKVPGRAAAAPPYGSFAEASDGAVPLSFDQQREKSRTIMLSLLPGLGHMSIGLMQRGITFLISFIGLFAIIVFLSVIMGTGALLIFLLGLPVIWIYSMFDAIQQLHAKQRGEQLTDRAIFEDLEAHIASGRKNKVLAIALSIFPGAGHLYLGLQKRGLQLMGGFLLTIYIMDNLRLSLFFFLLPLYWCFAFFDALQQSSRYERQTLTDDPVLTQLVPYQRWFGIALLGFGVYYLLDRVAAEVASRYSSEIYSQYVQIKYMIPTAVVAFIMIIVGLRLAFGSKTNAESQITAPPAAAPAGHSKQEEGLQ
ncbi:hypothetical protein [Paenibacillus prosopidis]|uniref:Multi-TM2 domain-containing protein n=1 Tax=Paenibacillus prosopidis TaxID=630520 RepID=A0A368VKT4_9BACL|nr:hypothetical protein [Paenibacillus prosopidis]RCW41203.1 hypothetical protein DFP97_12635 [Paenibacillus prosopidis]